MTRRRVAAWIALAAGAAAAAALAAGLLHNIRSLLVALAALAVTAGAAWYSASHRGGHRIAGLVGAAGALTALVVAVFSLASDIAFVAVALSLVVFATAARQATAEPAPSARPPLRRPRRAARAVLIVNPESGGGKAGRYDLVHEAGRRRVRTIVLEPGDDLRAIARDAARSAAVIGVAGGDGSQAVVADVAAHLDLAFVCIPSGTRNHFAHDLHIDGEDVVGALDAFTGGIEHRVDLAYVNERPFVNNVSLGVYAHIVQSDAYRNAKRLTTQSLLPTLLGPDAEPFDLRFIGSNGQAHTTAQLVLVSNNEYILDRIGGLGRRPHLDGGTLGILAVEIDGAADFSKLVALDAVGKVRSFHGWAEWASRRFEVDSRGPVAAGIDGEAGSLDPPLRFEVEPGALRVLLPPDAAAARPRAGAHELWETAVGRR